jgi:hypothetical protein
VHKGKEKAYIFPNISTGKTHVCAAHNKKPENARRFLRALKEKEEERITRLGVW